MQHCNIRFIGLFMSSSYCRSSGRLSLPEEQSLNAFFVLIIFLLEISMSGMDTTGFVFAIKGKHI